MPITPFIGVRISWLIVARNSDFIRVISCSCSLRCARLASSSVFAPSAAAAVARVDCKAPTTRRTRRPSATSVSAASRACPVSGRSGFAIATVAMFATASPAPMANSSDV